MDYTVSILLIVFCACISAMKPVTAQMARRRSIYSIYSNDFDEKFEPYIIAAFPLHATEANLRVLYPKGYANKFKRHTNRIDPDNDVYGVKTSHTDEPYAGRVYTRPPIQPKYFREIDSDDGEDSSEIIYARPDKNGGFTYRKPSAPERAPHSRDREPIIIRIHKYRVVH